jgi:hypothetical protein
MSSRWPQPDHHNFASFPPREKIPAEGLAPVEEFLALRVRRAEIQGQQREAAAALKTAVDTDQAALDEHVLAGGSAATFTYEHTERAKKAIADAAADMDVIERTMGKVYVKAVYALKGCTDNGVTLAETDIEETQAAYLKAINEVEQARRTYLEAVGLRYFWAYLDESHMCMATGGSGDQIVLARGPITKVDSHTFAAMRSDAKAHTRLNGDSEASSTW